MTTPERTPQQVGVCGACCDGNKIYLTQFLLFTKTFFSPNFVETKKTNWNIQTIQEVVYRLSLWYFPIPLALENFAEKRFLQVGEHCFLLTIWEKETKLPKALFTSWALRRLCRFWYWVVTALKVQPSTEDLTGSNVYLSLLPALFGLETCDISQLGVNVDV